MALKLVFLGRLEDAAGAAERDVAAVSSLAALFDALEPPLVEALSGSKVKVAVNGRIVVDRADCALSDGDEVAFLPPVSGG